MRALGGIPVNRRERTGFVDRMAQEFAKHERFIMVIAPEGTRARTEGWKSGFYRLVLAAGVPVLAGVADYRRKELGLLGSISLSGDEEQDMAAIAALYDGREGHTPSRGSPIKLLKS
jgi:hypothetical protein